MWKLVMTSSSAIWLEFCNNSIPCKTKFGYQEDIRGIKFCKVKFLCVCVWVLRAIGLLSFVCKIFPIINIADTAAQ